MRRLLGGPPKTSAKSSASKVSVSETAVLVKMDRVREDDRCSIDRRRGSADVNPIGVLHDSSISR